MKHIMEMFTLMRENKHTGVLKIPLTQFPKFINRCREGIDRDDSYLVGCLDDMVEVEKQVRETGKDNLEVCLVFKDGVLVEGGYQPIETK